MNLKEILELIDKVADSGISLLEVERAGVKIRIKGKRPEVPLAAAAEVEGVQAVGRAEPAAGEAGGAPPEEPENEQSWHVITSPIVGTFYRAPNPESEAFANVGDRIGKGSVLCIIEAMKLMNEIESDVEGVVMKVFPQNAQPVEYGEKLFAIRL